MAQIDKSVRRRQDTSEHVDRAVFFTSEARGSLASSEIEEASMKGTQPGSKGAADDQGYRSKGGREVR
jgi:hypothetical protein